MNKNVDKLNLSNIIEGGERTNNSTNDILNNGNILPSPVGYRDLDGSFRDFVKDNLRIIHDGKAIMTDFFTQQRFSEFTKTWSYVDENKNIQSNVILITRENNPQKGTLFGGSANIPGNTYYTVHTAEKFSGGKKIIINYKMKQPYCVDLSYNVKFITNKMNLLNEFNNKVIDTFKSNQAYVSVNKHFMVVTLESVDDESDYDLDERKVFVQNYVIKVKSFIINESDLIIEESVSSVFMDITVDKSKPYINFKSSSGEINIDFPNKSNNVISFKSKDDLIINSIVMDNIGEYYIYVNGNIINNTPIQIYKYDSVKVKILKNNPLLVSKITFKK